MVCTKCQRLAAPTTLATPGVKRRSEIYHGSPASGSGIGNSSSSLPSSRNKTSTSTTSSAAVLGNAGVSKSKLLSKAAKNPYASYGGSCRKCSGKTEQGKVLCHMCAYKSNSCAVCGKGEGSKEAKGKGKKGGVGVQPVVTGQKFSAK